MNKKNILNYPKSAAMGFFSKGLKNEFETAVVNEPSVVKPLKFYCIIFDFSFKVLDEGKVIEFNAPYVLLQKTEGFLRKLVDQTGKAEALHLMEIAKAAYNKEELPVPLPDGNVTIVENPSAEKENVANHVLGNKKVENVEGDSSVTEGKIDTEGKTETENTVDNSMKPVSIELEGADLDKNQDLTETNVEDTERTALIAKDKSGNAGDKVSGYAGDKVSSNTEDKVEDESPVVNGDVGEDSDSDTEGTALISKSDEAETVKKSDQ